jgi:hypothetical protein
MVAAGHPHPKALCSEQMAKLLKSDISVGVSAQQLLQCFFRAQDRQSVPLGLQVHIHVSLRRTRIFI